MALDFPIDLDVVHKRHWHDVLDARLIVILANCTDMPKSEFKTFVKERFSYMSGNGIRELLAEAEALAEVTAELFKG